MTANVAHHTGDTEYATRADIDALWKMLQGVVDALQHEIGQVAAARGLLPARPARPARSSHPLQPSRPDLRVVRG